MIQEELRKIPMLSELSSEWLMRLAEAGKFIEIESGSEILTPDGVVFVIREGEVNCFVRDAAEKRFLLGSSTTGDVLGELSFLSTDGSHDQKVELQAFGHVRCFSVPAEIFFAAIWSDRKANMHLNQLLARRLSAMNAFALQAVDVRIDPTRIPGVSFGEKLADFISAHIGSWRFLVAGVAFTLLWILVNVVGLLGAFDPYPFIFLNLVFSIISAATMPVLLMSQNRQNQLDRMAARVNHLVNLRSHQMLGEILKRIVKD